MKHNNCGYEWNVIPRNFKSDRRKSRCPICSHENASKLLFKSHEQFVKEVFEAKGFKYTVLGKYARSNTKIEMKHNECGFINKVKPNSFLDGDRCPKCKQPKGEVAIAKVLDKLKIDYDIQKKYCINPKTKRYLPYDFAIMKNGKPIAFIEYDGRQHFIPIDIFGGEDGFINTKERDNIKNKFAADNNIPLLRIPFTDLDNIERIVNDFVKELW